MTTDPSCWGQKAQVEDAWAFVIDHLEQGTYALTVGRDTSLTDLEGLKSFLRDNLGGQHDKLGGDPVG